jgi:signal recognition particle GTPase
MDQDAEALVKSARAYEKADEVGVCLIDTAGGRMEPPSWLERFLGVGE